MKPKYWIAALAVLLVVTNLFWLYQTIDTGITLTYVNSSAEMSGESYAQAVRLANLDLIGLPATEAVNRIENDPGLSDLNIFEKREDRCIVVGWVCVRLSEDRLVTGLRYE